MSAVIGIIAATSPKCFCMIVGAIMGNAVLLNACEYYANGEYTEGISKRTKRSCLVSMGILASKILTIL